ncbi:GspMb/PilO family protein [Rhodopirellula sp. MGV]|uniref:GspMb/PilO family protein n=1 Tax=Rhodopirellula sp. MGV TaxID=2023130 RepID=UPI000B9746AA|nr:GspMb/PilO family protein [Rhodopirellula sp. MGV]OYP29390.1 hypothetical protein CGZ80_24585 [Rhodopirellula sp. MGV]PNY35696.1 hypothetical protein C2E31_16540 [Rhodopirellula baltica]
MEQVRKQSDWRNDLRQLSRSLRDPLRMRLAIALVTLFLMCLVVYDPLQNHIRDTQRETTLLRDQGELRQEVELLQTALKPLESAIVEEPGNDVVNSQLIELFRDLPVEIQHLNADPPQRLGTLYTVRVAIDLAGTYAELSQAVFQLESQPQLVRVETIHIQPNNRGGDRPQMQLSLRVLKEQA